MRKRICLVVASESTIKAFLLDQLRALCAAHEVCVAAHVDDKGFLGPYGIGARVEPTPIERDIHPARDVAALLRLWRLFRAGRFDAVHSVTPKAGLLAMIAARVAGVPLRVHTFTGQVWATRRGAMRWLLKTLDRLTARMATRVLADSASQREFLVREGVVEPAKISVLADGSISGVDLARFKPDPASGAAVRAELQIPAGAFLLLYAGRLTRDKGLLELATAFASVAASQPAAHLVVVGPDEQDLEPRMRALCGACADRLRFVPFTPALERYLAAADVFCLPSHREGFGTVLIEAAAAGLPAVASRIYGITDAVIDGETGLLHEPRSPAALADAILRLMREPGLRQGLATKALARARERFSSQRLTAAVVELYREALP